MDEELIQQIEWLQQAEDDERREEDQSQQVLLALAGAVIAGAELSAECHRFSQPTVCTSAALSSYQIPKQMHLGRSYLPHEMTMHS